MLTPLEDEERDAGAVTVHTRVRRKGAMQQGSVDLWGVPLGAMDGGYLGDSERLDTLPEMISMPSPHDDTKPTGVAPAQPPHLWHARASVCVGKRSFFWSRVIPLPLPPSHLTPEASGTLYQKEKEQGWFTTQALVTASCRCTVSRAHGTWRRGRAGRREALG